MHHRDDRELPNLEVDQVLYIVDEIGDQAFDVVTVNARTVGPPDH
jgi:hypothetical protein